LITVQR